jgi:hypothetical protein
MPVNEKLMGFKDLLENSETGENSAGIKPREIDLG